MNRKVLAVILLLITGIVILYRIPAPQQNFFENYHKQDKVSESLRKLLQKPLKKVSVKGIEWTYYVGGNGNKTLLFIHGMGGEWHLWWQQIDYFQKDYKIISYTLPPEIKSLEETAEGIYAILEKEKIKKFIPVGTSMGGYIAQYLVYKTPERIQKVVFGNTFPPNTLIEEKNKSVSKILPYVPEILIAEFGEKQLNEKLLPASENSEIVKAFLPSLSFSKQQFLNRYKIVTDKFFPVPCQYKIKRIPKLIMEADNDPLIEEQLRKQLKKLYPDARVYTFHNKGHFPYLNAADEYNRVLETFLKTENSYECLEKTIHKYFLGRKSANVKILREVFSDESVLITKIQGKTLIIPFEKYLAKVQSDGKREIRTTLLDANISGNIAWCKARFEYAEKTYIDYLTLLRFPDTWRIISKTFTREK